MNEGDDDGIRWFGNPRAARRRGGQGCRARHRGAGGGPQRHAVPARRRRGPRAHALPQRVDDQGRGHHRRAAAGGTGAARPGRHGRIDPAGIRPAAVARRLRRRHAAPAPAGQQSHRAPADDPHRRPGLLLRQREAAPLPGADRRARPAVGPEAQPVGADGQRPGHGVGIRRQHRLAGAGGREDHAARAWAATCSSMCTARWAWPSPALRPAPSSARGCCA